MPPECSVLFVSARSDPANSPHGTGFRELARVQARNLTTGTVRRVDDAAKSMLALFGTTAHWVETVTDDGVEYAEPEDNPNNRVTCLVERGRTALFRGHAHPVMLPKSVSLSSRSPLSFGSREASRVVSGRASLVPGSVVLIAALAIGCGGPSTGGGSPSASQDAHDIRGDLYFLGVTYNGSGLDKCIGANHATASGSEVELTDGAGVTMGVGHLVEAADSGTGASAGNDLYNCHQTFLVESVKQADFYKVSIGGVKGPTFSYADLEGTGWTMTLHL